MASNLIIHDSEIMEACNDLTNYGERLNQLIDAMNSALKIVIEQAIQDTQITAELARISTEAERLKEPVDKLVTSAAQQCQAYLREIDSADRFLY